MIGTPEGVKRAGTIRRTGAHRRWNAELVWNVKGTPWKMNGVDDNSGPKASRIRWVTEEEREKGVEPRAEDLKKPLRMRLNKEDFFTHGITTGCAGCKSIINKTIPQARNDECRNRMENILEESETGK